MLLFGALAVQLFSQSEIQLTDRNLRRVVLQQLELDPERSSNLSQQELEQLTQLHARDAGITSLEGIQQARNLTELDLRGNNIADLTPLADMTQLTWLSLRENERITDIEPLRGLVNLTYLNLNRNHRIRSIEPLSDMQNLDTLILRSVGVLHRDSEQKVLKEIGHIERLNLRDTGLPSVAVLLPFVREGAYSDQLDLRENPLQDEHLLAPYASVLSEYEPPRSPFSGRVRGSIGALYGMDEWYGTAGSNFRDFADLQSFSPLFDLDLRLELDYRPRSFMRLYAEIETELDTETLLPEIPYLEELFIDYTLNYLHRFRFGIHSMEWGGARLLHNPGDMVREVEDGVALRADFQLATHHDLTMVVAGKGSNFLNPDQPAFPELSYAARYRGQAGWLQFGAASWYQHYASLPLGTSATIGAELGSLTLGGEIVAYWSMENYSDGNGWILSNVAWEPGDSDWEFIAEYMYDSTVPDYYGQFAGISIQRPDIFGWSPSVIWRHTLWRHNGEILPRLEREILPSLTATISLPLIYGDFSGYYRQESDIPGDRTFAAMVELHYVQRF